MLICTYYVHILKPMNKVQNKHAGNCSFYMYLRAPYAYILLEKNMNILDICIGSIVPYSGCGLYMGLKKSDSSCQNQSYHRDLKLFYSTQLRKVTFFSISLVAGQNKLCNQLLIQETTKGDCLT